MGNYEYGFAENPSNPNTNHNTGIPLCDKWYAQLSFSVLFVCFCVIFYGSNSITSY